MDPVRLLVCGGRDYDQWAVVCATLDRYHNYPGLVIIHGNASGADWLARCWAVYRGVPHIPFPARWDLYGRAAGMRRNAEMLLTGKPTEIVAFPGGVGTADMVARGRSRGIPVTEISDLL
jgi:hypothetical protein